MRRREFLRSAGVAALGWPLGACSAARSAAPAAASAPMPSAPPADAWIEVDAARLAHNLAQVRARVGGRPVMAVIKANGYGHGVVDVARVLARERVAALAVGKLEEAIALRDAGIDTPVLNFGAFTRDGAAAIVRRGIVQSVYTDDYRLLAEAARAAGRTARVHVELDTGLGRVGVPHDRALPLIEDIAATPDVTIDGVFTPFTEDDDYDREQLARFRRVCDAAARKGIALGTRHAASSAGVLSFPESHLDMVRPGIALYGEYPSTAEYRNRKIDLRPAMTLKTRVVYVKTLEPGDTVSYHRAFVAERRTRVATLAIGYSDGYPHRAAGRAHVLVRGRRFPLIGLVTSNHVTADVTGDRTHDGNDAGARTGGAGGGGGGVAIGDEAVLLGEQGGARVTAEELAAAAETSVYKILIQTSASLPRRLV